MPASTFRWFYLLFFISGFPALIYQIVWQRTLFAIYGVNMESVTLVVSAFMLGLGLGSLAGGRVSRLPSAPLLLLFGAVELGVACYGAASLAIFHAVARFTAGAPALETGLVSFALVVIPTVLMGATLPLLVAELVKHSHNTGRSVGILYFVNTLGSGVACFAAALVTMRYLGMSGSIAVAVALNILVGSAVLSLHFRGRTTASKASRTKPQPTRALASLTPNPQPSASKASVPFSLAALLSAAAGFLSLCYEIIWYRVYSFATAGPAECFAFVLGAFLLGIAFGSLLSRRLCVSTTLVRPIAILVLLANLLGFSVVPLIALIVRQASYLWTLPLVALTAGLLGATFPLICHISVAPDTRAGAGLSYLYLANILGSAAGSWLVGFVLMDYLTLRWISVLLALLGIALSISLFAAARQSAAVAACAALAAAVVFSSGPLFAEIYRQMEYKQEWRDPGARLADVVETRSGEVTVDADGAIFGGGAFDGWMTTDVHDTDLLIRPLALSFFHPAPKDVLEVGMSGGAWSEIIANHPQLEHLTVIEINPGYVEIVRRYPMVAPLLRNPKVEIVIDDGRRWMLRHRGRKFDVIVMDTIYFWRAHATNLLSVEFLDLARSLLKPGGVLYYNTTFSRIVQHTGAVHFPYAYRLGPFMAVSDSPIQASRGRWRDTLANYRLEGKPILDFSIPEDRDLLDHILGKADTLPGNEYVSEGMETRDNILRRTAGRPMITDDNMATEWRGPDYR